jgi:ubiquinone/menaquinone biosynthesis C-methylase UbiE
MHERRLAASHAHRLDSPARLLFLPPGEVLDALALHAGDTVADVGAGTGYFTLPMARAVGPKGKVYAVDAQAEMLVLLKEKLRHAGLANVNLVQAEADRTGLPPSICDLFFLANVWHELDDCAATLREARRVLKPQGRIAILDWRPDVEQENGPPLAHRLDSSHAIGHLRAAGLEPRAHTLVGRYSWLVQGVMRL